jgi:hypothetical protein
VASLALAEALVVPVPQGAKPRLLGTSPAEASFHLYTGFCQTVAANRLHVLPILQAIYAGKEKNAQAHWAEVYSNSIRLLADVFHSAVALGSMKTSDSQETKWLEKIPLAQVRPVRRPRHSSSPYRFTPYLDGFCLDQHRQPIPLALRFDDGTQREYHSGIGMGAHADFFFEYLFPAGVFARLRGALGLHPDLGRDGHVEMRWSLNGKVIWQQEFFGKHLAEPFDLDVSQGGWLVLHGKALTKFWLADENNLVLAEPLLLRSPNAPVGWAESER